MLLLQVLIAHRDPVSIAQIEEPPQRPDHIREIKLDLKFSDVTFNESGDHLYAWLNGNYDVLILYEFEDGEFKSKKIRFYDIKVGYSPNLLPLCATYR